MRSAPFKRPGVDFTRRTGGGVGGGTLTITGNSYTLSNSDNKKSLYFTANGDDPVLVAVPVGLAANFVAQLVQGGSSQIVMVPATGVIIQADNNNLATSKQFGVITLRWAAPDIYSLSGDVGPVIVRDLRPVNTALPTITVSESLLTLDVGSWTNEPGEFFFQWNRVTAPIEGAQDETYSIHDEDIGPAITVTITARNEHGDGIATSAPVYITGTAPVNTVAPTIIGVSTPPKVGEVATVVPGTWTGAPVPLKTYQWQSASVDIPDATPISYMITANDLGDMVRVVETATNSLGSANVTSAAVGPVAAGTDVTAPVLSALTVTPNGETAAFLSVTTTEGNGILYRTVQGTGIAAPSAAQIKAGQTGTGAAATSAGVIDTASVDTWGDNPTGLSAGTTYDVYAVMTDAAGNNSNIVTATFTTAGSTTPTLTAQSCPDNADIFAWLQVTTNNGAGTLYAVGVPLDDPAPSAAQIKLGQNSTGAAAPNVNVAVTSPGTKLMLLRGLAAATPHKIYMVQNVTAGDSNVVNTPLTTDVLVAAFVTNGATTGLAAPSSSNGSLYTANVADPYGGTNAVNWHDNGDNSPTNKAVSTSVSLNPFYSGTNKIHISFRWVSGGEWIRSLIGNTSKGGYAHWNSRTGQIGGAANRQWDTLVSFPINATWQMISGSRDMVTGVTNPDLIGIISFSVGETDNDGYVTARDGTHSRDIYDIRITRAA